MYQDCLVAVLGNLMFFKGMLHPIERYVYRLLKVYISIAGWNLVLWIYLLVFLFILNFLLVVTSASGEEHLPPSSCTETAFKDFLSC